MNVQPTPSPSVRRYLRRKAAAKKLDMSIRTLEDLARRGIGPKYFKPMGRGFVLYDEQDLEDWVAAGLRTSTAEPELAAAQSALAKKQSRARRSPVAIATSGEVDRDDGAPSTAEPAPEQEPSH